MLYFCDINEKNLKLHAKEGNLLLDPSVYRHLIGRLLYLTITRLDILFIVNLFSQFIQALRQPHFEACLRVLRYLKGSHRKAS